LVGAIEKYFSTNSTDFAAIQIEFSGDTLNSIVNPSSCLAMIDVAHLVDIQKHGYASISCIKN